MAKMLLGPWHFLVLHLIFTFFVWLIFRFGLQFSSDFSTSSLIERQCRSTFGSRLSAATPRSQRFAVAVFFATVRFAARSLADWAYVAVVVVAVVVAPVFLLSLRYRDDSPNAPTLSLSPARDIALLHFTHCSLFSSALLGRFSAESFFFADLSAISSVTGYLSPALFARPCHSALLFGGRSDKQSSMFVFHLFVVCFGAVFLLHQSSTWKYEEQKI